MSLFALYHTRLECVDFADGRFGLEHFLLLQPLGSIINAHATIKRCSSYLFGEARGLGTAHAVTDVLS